MLIPVIRDLDEVRVQLLERLGLRRVELAPLERELVEGVASIAQAAPGVPKMSGLYIGARALGRQMRYSGNQYQKFVYREFVDAWKRSGA